MNPAPIQKPSSSQPLRFPGMDGVRAIAALAIVAFHAYLSTSWATVGAAHTAEFTDQLPAVFDGAFRNLTIRTNIFFVLSGMLLAIPFVRWILETDRKRPSIRRFTKRRIRRIWPLYLIVMLAAAATVTINKTSVEQIVTNALLIQNMTPGGQYLHPVTWTLTVELGFYLALPIVMLLLAPALRRLDSLALRTAALIGVGISGFVTTLALRVAYPSEISGVSIRTTVLGHLDSFGAGILAAVFVIAALVGRGEVARTVRKIPALAWTSTGLLLVTIGLYGRWHQMINLRGHTDAWWWSAPVALGIACWLLAIALRPDHSWLARVVSSPPLLWIGQISYGIFLWHYVFLHWMSVSGITRSGGVEAVLANTAIVLALTIPAAWLSWHVIESPMIDGRIKLPRPHFSWANLRFGALSPAPEIPSSGEGSER